MIKATATEVRNNFGEFVEKARRAPVVLQRNGRDTIVMVDAEEYRRLVECAARAEASAPPRPRKFGFARDLISGSFDLDDNSHLQDFAEYMP